MRRLYERQVIHLSRPEGDGRPRPYCVIAVDRPTAALYPITPDARDVGSGQGEHFLAFESDGRPVALRGVVRALAPNDLRFAPTDGVELPRRATTRLAAAIPFEVATLDGASAAIAATTIDFSATGALLEDPGVAGIGELVRFSFAPDASEVITGQAHVVRQTGGELALAFQGLDPETRHRIAEHVIAEKRTQLEADVAARLGRAPADGPTG